MEAKASERNEDPQITHIPSMELELEQRVIELYFPNLEKLGQVVAEEDGSEEEGLEAEGSENDIESNWKRKIKSRKQILEDDVILIAEQ